MTTAPAVWYLMRATGIVALLMLTVSLALGIATTKRWRLAGLPGFATVALHRNASLLAVVFLAVHIATALADPDAAVSLAAVVVPGVSAHSPLWLGLGALSLDLLLASIVTSLLRERFGRRLWRTVHWGAYLCWPFALVHGLGIGSDTGQTWFLALAALAVAGTAAASLWRLSGRSGGAKQLGLGARREHGAPPAREARA